MYNDDQRNYAEEQYNRHILDDDKCNRTLVLVGKIGPAFSGTHSRYSGIGSRFDFSHYGEVTFVQNAKLHDHWLLSNRPIPMDIPQDILFTPLG